MDYKIIRSNRKSLGLEIKPDGQVIVRAPMRLSEREIQRFVIQHEDWIREHLEIIKQKQENRPEIERLTMQEIQELADQALKVIPQRVAYDAPKVGVSYGKITIRNQKSRWGSCSSKGNLNFNWRIIMAPARVADYVIVHEMCHLKYLDHSREFWSLVEEILPDYKERKEWLHQNGHKLY